MSDRKIISIIIPTYNRVTTLPNTVKSILSQKISYPVNVEIVIIDDNSTDTTEQCVMNGITTLVNDACSKSEDVKYYLEYMRNLNGPRGPSESRNIGLMKSRGSYIIFLDSDDAFYDNTAIQELYGQMATNERMGVKESFVYGDTLMYTFANGSWVPSHTFTFPRFDRRRHIESMGIIPMGSFIFTKSAVANEVVFNPNISVGEDFEWQVRIAMKIPFIHIEKTVLKYFRGATGQLVTKLGDTRERERSHSLMQKTLSMGMSRAMKEEEIKIPWNIVPYFPNLNEFEGYKDDLVQLSKDLSSLYTSTLHKHVDLLFDGKLYSHKERPKDGVSILWIVPGMKLQNNELYKIIAQYSIILTFNCSYTESLKSILKEEGMDHRKFVGTLPFPMVDLIVPRAVDSQSFSSLYLTSRNETVESELEDCGYMYEILDEEVAKKIPRNPGIIVMSGSKYFNSRNYFRYARYGCPIVSVGKLGAGLILNNQHIYLRDSFSVCETIEPMVRAEFYDRYRNAAAGARTWCLTNPRFSVKEFAEKFDSIVRRAVIELSDWDKFNPADKEETEGEAHE